MASPLNRVKRTTLPRSTCVSLLANADFARVVISVRCLPAALPARIGHVDDQHLLLASTEEAVIVAARRGDVLSVQIDGLESDNATWSVMASGIAHDASREVPDDLSATLSSALEAGAGLISLPLTILVGARVGGARGIADL